MSASWRCPGPLHGGVPQQLEVIGPCFSLWTVLAVLLHVEDVAEKEGHRDPTHTEEADGEDPYIGALVGDRGEGLPGAEASKDEEEVDLDDELGNPVGLPVQIAPDCNA